MPFDRPTLQTIVDRIQSDFESRIDGASTILRRSVLRVMGRVYAGATHLLYGYLSFLKDQLFATSADIEFLETIGSEYGISRKSATRATGEATATGTNGTTIPAGTELQSTDGEGYTVDTEVSIASGVADLSLTAVDAGTDGNADASDVLSFVSPIAGITSTVSVDSNAITGGLNEESDDDLRDRILARKRQPPHGGAEFDYDPWALEVAGVTRAWAFSEYNGHGTVGLAFVRDKDTDTIIPDDDQRDAVYDYIVSHTSPLTGTTVGAPVGAHLYMIPLTLYSLDYEIDVTPNNATIQASIRSNLKDLILQEGGPGETITLPEITAAISRASGHINHRINSPSADVAISTNRIPVLGTITFGDF